MIERDKNKKEKLEVFKLAILVFITLAVIMTVASLQPGMTVLSVPAGLLWSAVYLLHRV